MPRRPRSPASASASRRDRPRAGRVVRPSNLPLAGVRFQALMAERLGLPVVVDNDANCAMLAEWRHGAARGATDAVLLTLGTGIGGGHRLRRQARPRRAGGGARDRAHGARRRRPAVPGRLPQPRLPRVGTRPAPRSAARASARRARPDTALGREAGGGRASHRCARDRAGARRRRGRARGASADRPRARRRDRRARQHLQPRGDRHRRRRDRGGRPAARARARGRCCAARRCARRRDVVRVVAAAFGAEAGMLGAATLALDELGASTRADGADRAARRLPDADRQPRGRHAARARARCARPTSSPARTRATRGAARPLRRRARRSSATTSTTSARGRRELVERMRGGESVALVSDAGMPLVSDPGYVLVRRCVAAGLEVEVLPGPAALAALVASALPADRGASPASCRARGRAARGASSGPETLVAFESPRRVGASLALLAELDPGAPVAVCRELTRRRAAATRTRPASPSPRASSRAARRACAGGTRRSATSSAGSPRRRVRSAPRSGPAAPRRPVRPPRTPARARSPGR